MRIGILGVAHLHADAYIGDLHTAGAHAVGVYDHDRLRARVWGTRFGVAVHDELDTLLSSDLDAVIVCSETAHHAVLVQKAAEAGCAVLCEKPLGVSFRDSRQIVADCTKAGVTLMTAFPVRFHPAVIQLRQLVKSGRLGNLRSLTGTNQSVMPLRDRAWFADPALSGGGAMMDHIVHLADIYGWLLGSVPERVYAVANRIVHSEVVSVETSGLVMLDYPGGVFASIDCSWNRPLSYPSWGGIGLSAVGERGVVEVDAMRQRLTRFGGSSPLGWAPWGVDMNQLMIEEFLSAVRDRREPTVTGNDGLAATAVALLAVESTETGAPIPWHGITQDPEASQLAKESE